MSRSGGIVPAALTAEIAATLAARLPGLPEDELHAHARAITDALAGAGWRITAPTTRTRAPSERSRR